MICSPFPKSGLSRSNFIDTGHAENKAFAFLVRHYTVGTFFLFKQATCGKFMYKPRDTFRYSQCES